MTGRVAWRKQTRRMGFRMSSPRVGEEQKASMALSGPSYGSSPWRVESTVQNSEKYRVSPA